MTKITRRTALGTGLTAAAGLAAGVWGCRPAAEDGSSPVATLAATACSGDVIVIGAGLSGLNATLLLEEMGFNVCLIEGRDRVGGRLFTLDDVPGAPEGGGSAIGSMYGRLLGATDRYQIPLGKERRRSIPSPENSMINLRGTSIQLNEWESHDLNPMPEGHRERMPWFTQYALYGDDNPLTSTLDVTKPELAEYDISVFDHFRARGFSDPAIELGANTNMSYGDASGAHGLSALMMHHIMAFGSMSTETRPGSPFAGVGGNQRIPEALAQQVRGEIQFGVRVVGLRSETSHAEVHLDSGQVLKAKGVIVTAPFSALRLMNIDAPMHPMQRRAIRTIGYTNVTQVHFVPNRRFWEEDGLPPTMWTDGPSARFMALRNNPQSPEEITSFVAFTNDKVANHLDRLGAEAATRHVLRYLEAVRPSTKGALDFVKFFSWQQDPFAGGAYAAWRPGQLTTFGRYVALPAGRIHFAGEHTAFANRGMEAAMESGERAAFAVAESL